MTDPIADMLTRIRNANQMRNKEVSMPVSKIKTEIHSDFLMVIVHFYQRFVKRNQLRNRYFFKNQLLMILKSLSLSKILTLFLAWLINLLSCFLSSSSGAR